MSNNSIHKQPTNEAIMEALQHSNGWVYEIDESYKGAKEIPPSAIKGAWKVNAKGTIDGEYIPNPDYKKSL